MAFPEPAAANPLDKLCSLVGTLGEGWWGKACKAVAHPKQVVGAVKAIATGKPGKAVSVLLNGAKSNVLSTSGAIGIAAIVAWAVGGAHFVLSETAKLLGQTTSPELTASWFSSVYWRVAGVAALMTLPFLIAAAIQAVLRSDAALLARAVFGYLPLSFLATGIAAPLAMLLLQVTDWMGSWVAAAAGDDGSHFLADAGVALGALGVAAGSPFVTFLIALLTTAGGLILWLELLVREAAVYVVVLMLPLVFSAMVWPARRVWAVRAVEVLVALILAKFAIVSVLALAAAALTHGGGDLIVRSLAGLVLVVLGSFAPWVLLRLLPLAEVASAAVGHVREQTQARMSRDGARGQRALANIGDGVSALVARMQTFQAGANQVAGAGADGGTSGGVADITGLRAATLKGQASSSAAEGAVVSLPTGAVQMPPRPPEAAAGEAAPGEPADRGHARPRDDSSRRERAEPDGLASIEPPIPTDESRPSLPEEGDDR
ncbi:MAG TPA: hypothetical protein VGH93_10720 [Solirubrobacteraceae bacterium]